MINKCKIKKQKMEAGLNASRKPAFSSDTDRSICRVQQCRYLHFTLNKPAEARNEYTYTVTGAKLRVVHRWNPAYSNSPVIGSAVNAGSLTEKITVDYAGNKIYKNGVLEKIMTGNGYYENGKYYFYIRDHLGNNRVVADQAGNEEQSTQYYPFGMVLEETGREKQAFKFGGKELDMMNGLNLYDFVARPYDPNGWFLTPDPLAEKYPGISTYAYCGNNPGNNVDPWGMDYWSTSDIFQIQAFINAMGSGATQFDFSAWNHMTDTEFSDRLSYNDETGKFYTSYGTIENGEVVINGRSFDANLTPVSFSGEGYPGAFVYQRRTGFFGLIENIDSSINPYSSSFNSYNDGTNSWSVNSSGRIIGIAPPAPTMGYPPAVGKGGKISTKGMPHGDGGRALTQAERKIAELQKQLKTATKAEQKVINKKIQNIREIAQQKAKGETHWRK